ncbi:MAG: hypothetical protein U1E45_04950 [Geminicoccaceae bacterium]
MWPFSLEPLIEDLLVDLVERPARSFTRRDLLRLGSAGAALLRWGALHQRETSASFFCDQCGDDHDVAPVFDSATSTWRYYCGSVGFVRIQEDDFVTYSFDRQWLTTRLVKLLSIQRPECVSLIDDVMWRLGTGRLDATFWTAILVRDVDRHLDNILDRLKRAGRGHPGLLLSSSDMVPRLVTLPNDYRWLPLQQLLCLEHDALGVRETAIRDALGYRKQRDGGRGKAGRPGAATLVLREFHRRAEANEVLGTVAEEARHLASWLGQNPRSISRSSGSIENIIRTVFKELKENTPRATK